jgi:hypothetical protein
LSFDLQKGVFDHGYEPHLLQHIQEVEAAFPSYELVPEQIIAEADLVGVRGFSVANPLE